MRIVTFDRDRARQVTNFGSSGLRAQAVLRGDEVAVTILRVAAGGEIGRHPTVVDQLFLVVVGNGAVSGADGEWRPIAADQAAVWTAGEEHATRAYEDLTAVVVEMPTLPLVDR